MSSELIKSIRKQLQLRIILPLGLNVHVGDVVGVNADGTFTLEGSSDSILGPSLVKPRQPDSKGDLYATAASSTKVNFRAAGTASANFPNLPNGNAGFDISFASANQWVFALVGQSLQALEEVNRFRIPILTSYQWGVWQPHWALITSILHVDKVTFLASQSKNTNVALSLSAPVNAAAPLQVNLTAGATIVATTNRITQYISNEPSVVLCSAIRVKDPWWSLTPYLKDLAAPKPKNDPQNAPDDKFWTEVE